MDVLRLSKSTTSSLNGCHIQGIISSAAFTNQQKTDCLKLLKIVLKNLLDPAKVQDPKYRQLRLDNEKIKSKVCICPQAMQLLNEIGFVQATDDNNQPILRIDEVVVKQHFVKIQSSYQTIFTGIDTITNGSNGSASSSSLVNKKPANKIMVEKLSEKQKARILLEQKQKEEKIKAREEREKNIAMLKQDKFVRQNDANWTSGVSAACAKSGSGISTFRDKYGE